MATPSCPNNCPDRTRPGSRRLLAWHTGGGHWRAGAALPGGSCPDGVYNYREAAVALRHGRSHGRGVGAAGLRRQPVESRSGGSQGSGEHSPPAAGALDPGLGLSAPRKPPARENPGPLPGAAALPGREGGGDSRNLPGDRAGVTELNRPIYGQRFRNVSGESPGAQGWAGPCWHIPRFVLGSLFPATARLRSFWCQHSGDGRSGRLYWTLRYLKGESYKQRRAWGSPVSLPAWKKKRPQKLIKTIFFT